MILKNKKGFIRIFEAFVAILLITGVVLFVINKGYIGKEDASQRFYNVELSVLREIQLNNNLRQEILEIDVNQLPIENDDGSGLFPFIVNQTIDNRIQGFGFLACKVKICELDRICTLQSFPLGKDVFAQSIAITSTLEIYQPRQLKMFCWEK